MRRTRSAWRWSISRSHLLRECARAFEFQLRNPNGVRDAIGAVRLSALTGIAIHEGISSELDRWAVGERATERGAIVHANEFINQVWNEREQRIIEIRNGLDIDSTQLAVYLHLVRSRLERFFQMIWPQFSDMRHESHESLQEFRGCALPVGVKIDLACWNREDQLVIADWKTGSWQNLLGSRVQLAVYALWARTALKLGIAAILPTIVSLQTGEIERFHPTEDDFDFVKDEVESDKRRVEDYRRAGEFPASPRPEKCWGCAYLSSCREGSETVGL